MTFKRILISICLILSTTVYSQISVRVYTNSHIVDSLKEVSMGLEVFKKALKRSCNLEVDFNLREGGLIFTDDIEFKSERVAKVRDTIYGPQKMSFYQFPLYETQLRNNIISDRGGINFYYIPGFNYDCGYAFPRVQLKKLESRLLRTSLTNSILIFKGARACGSRPRMIAHELAHLFIQDEPAHLCGNKKCAEPNILALEKKVQRNNKPGFSNQPRFDEIPSIHNPIYDLVPARGTRISKDQCQSIKETLRKSI